MTCVGLAQTLARCAHAGVFAQVHFKWIRGQHTVAHIRVRSGGGPAVLSSHQWYHVDVLAVWRPCSLTSVVLTHPL